MNIRSPHVPEPPRRRSRLLRGLAVAALALPLAAVGACGGGSGSAKSDQKVELSVFWWGGPERAKVTEQALDLYTSKHPNVTFKKEWQGNAGYFEKLSTRVAGGSGGPDIFQIDDNAITEYASRGITLDLSSYVKNKTIDVSKFPKSLVDYGVVKGKTAGIAAAENTPAMYYDKTVAESLGLPEPKTGMTWEELISWGEQVTARSGGRTWGTMDPSADYKALWVWLRQQGKEFYDNDKLGFTAADVTRWFELWADARKRGAAPPADIIHTANDGSVTKQLVVTRTGATSFMWSNQMPELQKGTQNKLGLMAYPGDPKGQWARASMYWSGFRGTKHPKEVANVINFLVNDPEAAKILGTDRGLYSNLDIRRGLAGTLAPEMQATVALEDELTPKFGPAPTPPPKGHSKIKTQLVGSAEAVQYGKATPQQAAEQFVSQAAEALKG
ncbi:ABC transporter substrate-binding protein [Planosporangium sp. 12N6]|uniref:ABC transporter substrate-binding protein n=1 Tax=Planosporangium spinosum TaxID=3402278 RepID=UPI003CF3B5D3